MSAEELNFGASYRAILSAAREGEYISYKDLASEHGLDFPARRHVLFNHLGELAVQTTKRGWPILSSIVVNEANVDGGEYTKSNLNGFIAAARMCDMDVRDPRDLHQKHHNAVFAWAHVAPDDPVL